MRRAGFTLLEVLAVVLLTAIVVGVALDHYVNLSRASQRATESTRDVRRAVAVLDAVARDLQNAVLVAKPPEADPLTHPWIFYAEAVHGGAGADHLKFVTRARRPRADGAPESDLEVVVFALRPAVPEDGVDTDPGFELMRWSSPRLPEGLDRTLPDDEDDGAQLLADGLAEFSVRFVDEVGESATAWDSSQLEASAELPLAADIEVALLDPDADPSDPDYQPQRFHRRVLLPARPLDFEELFDPTALVSGGTGDAEGAEGDEDSQDQCGATPCRHMTACEAIGCSAKLGRYGGSIDTMIEHTMMLNLGFCQWRSSWPKNVRWIIDNPACR
jgi:prepilin-type N-terminal cleavage/methylation domain-containing protein